MELVESIAIVVGLIVFEVVNSIDNAIVNAHVLKTNRCFLGWHFQGFVCLSDVESAILIFPPQQVYPS
jgi:hypothetical protein